MAVYTCYDMIQDCRADKPEGWTHFITQYIFVIQVLIRHYYPSRSADADLVNRVLLALRKSDPGFFAVCEPLPEREFVAELRQFVLSAVEEDSPTAMAEISLELDTLSAALEPFTSTEKQVVWLETMRYEPEQTAAMIHMHAATVEKTRDKASEMLRGRIDSWRRSLFADNGPALRTAAAASRTEQCHSVKTFFDWLDGRITWQQRDDVDRHLVRCWRCVDLFCRVREVQVLLRGRKPLSTGEAEPFRRLLELPPEKPSLWKRMLAGR